MTTTSLVHIASIAVQLHGADLHPWVHKNARELTVAFVAVESSGRNLKPYRDGKDEAWGLLAYHRPRWYEYSREGDWGTASPQRQVTIHLFALSRYCRLADKAGNRDYLRACCIRHNGFGGCDQARKYYNKIVKAWPQ